jgi:hypothetical protein
MTMRDSNPVTETLTKASACFEYAMDRAEKAEARVAELEAAGRELIAAQSAHTKAQLDLTFRVPGANVVPSADRLAAALDAFIALLNR